MLLTREQLQALLVEPGHVSQEDWDAVVVEAERQRKEIDEILLEKGLILDEQLGRLLAEAVGVPFMNLRTQSITPEMLQILPEEMARTRGVMAFGVKDGVLQLGMVYPKDVELLNMIARKTGVKVQPYLVTRRDLRQALGAYVINQRDQLQEMMQQLEDPTFTTEQRDAFVVKMAESLLRLGYRSQASDLHLEPQTDFVMVRFRIDGVMQEIMQLPKKVLGALVMRIKVMAKLRTDEHQSSQDGKFRMDIDEEAVDVRVSIVPVTKGENVVMRLLTNVRQSYTLPTLGLGEEDFALVEKGVHNPHGMILVSGPTGSGKTTSVYAMLRMLNTPDVHIASIEDPVEYDIAGVSQIQVNSATNLTFAEGLRAIVRQDPDIIVVGEIRDFDTADIAVNAAMTGHLVLSTLHANDAGTTVMRLVEMGVEPFLVASTVNLVIAQRLVRKICEACRQSFLLQDLVKDERSEEAQALRRLQGLLPEKEIKQWLKSRLYRGEGCAVCKQTGYQGRLGIFEVMLMTQEIRELVTSKAHADEIVKVFEKGGGRSLLEDGLAKVKAGLTTLDEVMRVVHD